MTEGGVYWFTDLTVADPYYLLPIASSAVFLLTVELGAADGMQVTSQFLITCCGRVSSAHALSLKGKLPTCAACMWGMTVVTCGLCGVTGPGRQDADAHEVDFPRPGHCHGAPHRVHASSKAPFSPLPIFPVPALPGSET